MVTIHLQPTLFVFLGTSARQVGARLKRMVNEIYGPLPVLRFLWVDTDDSAALDAAREGDAFTAEEQALLTGFDGDAVLANLSGFPATRAWWPRESKLKPGFIRTGARQIRLFGRLALFRQFGERSAQPAFIDRLSAATQAIQQIETRRATEAMSGAEKTFVVDRVGTQVYVIFSTCGGTGSAISFDVAYLCQSLLAGSNPTITALALLPPVLDLQIRRGDPLVRRKTRANTYAWFKENDHLMQDPVWSVQYPEGARVELQSPPFHQVLVFSAGNQANQWVNEATDIYTMLAQALFLYSGTAVASAVKQQLANLVAPSLEFQGRRRNYSSLASAALIFPAEKVQAYCAASLAREMIAKALLATPAEGQAQQAAAGLLASLNLRDAGLMDLLLAERQVPGDSLPGLQKAKTVADALRNLDAQQTQDDQELPSQRAEIGTVAQRLLAQAKTALEGAVGSLALSRGIALAQAVLEEMAGPIDPRKEAPEGTVSLLGLKRLVEQKGVTTQQLNETDEARARARQRIGRLDGSLKKWLAPKAWRRDLTKACTDWLSARFRRVITDLQLAAQREALQLYDQLLQHIEGLRSGFSQVAQLVKNAEVELGEVAARSLAPATQGEGVYELAREAVDAEFIRAYYQRHGARLDAVAIYQEFVARVPEGERSVSTIKGWGARELAQRLLGHAEGAFAPRLQQLSLLKALREHYGDEAEAEIKKRFDDLVTYCNPFWRYDRDRGHIDFQSNGIIGLEDEADPLVPPEYRTDPQYELKSTGLKHRVDALRLQYTLPAFLLLEMPECRTEYATMLREGIDPLHILPGAAEAEEVIPEDEERRRRQAVFAEAVALSYIVQIGAWYYFDPTKEYTQHNIHPGRELRLNQGRENSEVAFLEHADWVQQIEQKIENDIEMMGNVNAIKLLDERIAEYRKTLAAMSPENELRRQYQKEVGFLSEKQRQLGRVGS